MTPSQDNEIHPDDESEREEWDAARPRSLFSTMWFRAVVVLVVVGGIAAISVPYVLDSVSPPPKPAPTAVVPSPPAKRVAAPPAKSGEPPAPAVTAPAVPQAAVTASSRPEAPTTSPAQATPPAPAASAPAKSAEPEKVERPTEAPKRATAKASPETITRRESKRVVESAPAPKTTGNGAGEYWVQVGAFRDPTAARRLAERLRSRNLPVEESTTTATLVADKPVSAAPAPAPESSDRYEVLVTGTSPSEVTAKLAAKGLSASPVAGGALVKPSLPLRDAVALSQDLSADGFKVQVKRAGSAEARAASSPTAGTRETLHRVRVGAFPDRASAVEARRKLEDLGYTAFIARGRE